MIHHLKGILVEKKPPIIVIDVNGVGYELYVSMNTIYNLSDIGQPLSLLTQLVIREDAHTLYGFYQEQERTLFKTLIKVSGIGPKTAITLLSSITADALVQSIQQNDTATLVRLPGIGKKTAERLIIEMRDRLDDWQGSVAGVVSLSNQSHAEQDALSALVALGYKAAEAKRAMSTITTTDKSSEELIRLSLKFLAR